MWWDNFFWDLFIAWHNGILAKTLYMWLVTQWPAGTLLSDPGIPGVPMGPESGLQMSVCMRHF